MKRLQHVHFVRPKAMPRTVLLCLLIAGLCLSALPPTFNVFSSSDSAFAAELRTDSIDGTWKLSLPMPGGTKESILVLSIRGNTISGTMSNPGVPTDVHSIYDGIQEDGSFRFSVDIGRITYYIEGTHGENTLSFDMKTTETIPLDNGRRLSGSADGISGRYLVPVYSPGGIMENHFELTAENGTISGQMYVPVTDNDASPDKMEGGPPGMEAPPGGPPAGAPTGPPGGTIAASDGKRDVNTFFDGTYEGNHISLFTRTAQDSLFHFTGTVSGDAIKLTLNVTDQRKDLEAFRVE